MQLFSALKRVGIDEANDKILELAGVTDDEAAAQVERIEVADDDDDAETEAK